MGAHEYQKPPLWILILAVLFIPGWFLFMYYDANVRSGWGRLVSDYQTAPRGKAYPHKRIVAGVVKPSGRLHVFADEETGRSRRGKIDLGFDDEAFWMRGRFRGLTYGPRRSLYVPWDDVQRCDHTLRIHLADSRHGIYVQYQPLLDKCAEMTGGR